MSGTADRAWGINGGPVEHALFALPPRSHGVCLLNTVGRLRGWLPAKLRARLHGGRLRGRRHRLDQDRLSLRHRLRSGTIHRSAGAGLHHTRASNGATLEAKWEFKRNIRPWSRALYIGVVKDFLAPGNTITVRFGSPG